MSQMLYYFVWILPFLMVASSKDVFVNVSLSTANGTTYPTLQQAFQSLYSNISQLIDYNNTITLLPECASQVLSIGNATLAGLSTGGVLNISFSGNNSNQKMTNLQICSQLPVISLSSNNSFLQISNLTYFSLFGVAVQFSGTNNTNQLFNITAVNFTNFCLNNTEPTLGSTGSLSNTAITTFTFNNIVNVQMTNGLYTYDSFKTLLITNSSQVNLSSMTFYVLNTTRDLNNQALNISSPNASSTAVVNANNIQSE